MYKKDELNILYSSDDNYAQHMGISIYSLLEHNRSFSHIQIFIIDNEISENNKNKLCDMINEFQNVNVIFIPFQEWKDKLQLNMSWNISVSSYARLFVAEMLPKTVDRVLYMDCDMIICASLEKLWTTSLQGRVLAAVQDSVSPRTKEAVGLSSKTKYFNAGLLFINLIEWRRQNMGIRCLEFITAHNGNVTHHDQGTLNGVLNGEFLELPLRYNLMTIHYFFNRAQVLEYFKEEADFYSEKEIVEAKKRPVVIHYTPSFTSRPWCKNCKHPLKFLYWKYIEETPWKGSKMQKSNEKWYIKLINWKYRHLKNK